MGGHPPVPAWSGGLAHEAAGGRGSSRPARVGALRRLRRLAELFPWTPLGVALTVAAYAALQWMAFAQLDLVFLVLGYAGLSLTVLTPLLSLIGAIWLRLRGPLPAPDGIRLLETGVEAETGFAVSSLWFLPFVQVQWSWENCPRAQVHPRARRGRLRERLLIPRRGRYRAEARRLVVRDTLGLSRLVVRLRGHSGVDVLPRLEGLRHLPSMTALASGDALPHPMGLDDGDRLELVRYTPGDPARFIHWKVFGRTRRLMLRVPERALAVARRTAAFMLAGPDDDASAAVARLAIEQRLLGVSWVFGTDAAPHGAERAEEALQLLMASGELEDAQGRGLAAFVEEAEQSGPVRLIVFAPPRPGPWVDRVAGAARRRSVRVVIGVDAVYDAEPVRWWQRLLWAERPTRGTEAAALEEVTRVLAAAGCEVRVLERSSGRLLGSAHTRAMRALERRQVA